MSIRAGRIRRALILAQLGVMAAIVVVAAAILVAGQVAPLFQQHQP